MTVFTMLFLKIFNMSLTAGIVILMILPVRCLLKKFPCNLSYVLWLVVAFRLMIPVSVDAGISVFNMHIFESDETGTDSSGQETDAFLIGNGDRENRGISDGIEDDMYAPAELFLGHDMAASAQPTYTYKEGNLYTGAAHPISIVRILALFWLAGIVTLVSYSAAAQIAIRKKTKYGIRLYENVYECDDIRSPFVNGIFLPRIYMPFRLAEKERQFVLMHERYHIKRKDYLVKRAAFMLVIVHWFNPLVWLAFCLMSADMEISCDEKVISKLSMEMRKEYSRLLLAFASNKRRMPSFPLAFGEENIMKRIKSILGYQEPVRWKMPVGMIIIMITMAACATDAADTNDVSKTGSLTETRSGYATVSEHENAAHETGETNVEQTDDINMTQVSQKEGKDKGIAHREAQWAKNTMCDHELCILDYADEETIVFHISSGLFRYDLQSRCITESLDLQALSCQRVQTGGTMKINIFQDESGGMRAAILPYPYTQEVSYIYDFSEDKLYSYDETLLENDTLFDGLVSKYDLEDADFSNKWRVSEYVLPLQNNTYGVMEIESLHLDRIRYKTGDGEWQIFPEKQSTLPELLKQDDSFYQSFVLNTADNVHQCMLEYTGFYNAHDYAGMCALSTGLEYSDTLQKEWRTHTDMIGGGSVYDGVEGDSVTWVYDYFADEADKESKEVVYVTARYIDGQGWRVDSVPTKKAPEKKEIVQ